MGNLGFYMSKFAKNFTLTIHKNALIKLVILNRLNDSIETMFISTIQIFAMETHYFYKMKFNIVINCQNYNILPLSSSEHTIYMITHVSESIYNVTIH